MSKKSIVISSLFVYAVCVVAVVIYSKKHFVKKDMEFQREASAKLDNYFGSKKDIVSILYSGEDVEFVHVRMPRMTDYIKDKYDLGEGNYHTKIADSKRKYKWKKAYGDIYKMYELVPRYDNDVKYQGFRLSILHKGNNCVYEYALSPRYIGLKNNGTYQYYGASYVINQAIDEVLDYLKKDTFRQGFSEKRITTYNIEDAINTPNYGFFTVDASMSKEETERDALLGNEPNIKSYSHNAFYQDLPSYEEVNDLGYNMYYENDYCKVFLEATPWKISTIRYKFLYDPMSREIKDFLIHSISSLTALLLLFLFLFLILHRKRK